MLRQIYVLTWYDLITYMLRMKHALDQMNGLNRVELGVATKKINIARSMFGVGMNREMAFGQNVGVRVSFRLELMACLGHNV